MGSPPGAKKWLRREAAANGGSPTVVSLYIRTKWNEAV